MSDHYHCHKCNAAVGKYENHSCTIAVEQVRIDFFNKDDIVERLEMCEELLGNLTQRFKKSDILLKDVLGIISAEQ